MGIIKKYGIKREPLASLAGILEELGELSSVMLVKEGFKTGSLDEDIDYKLAEVFFELLKLAVEYNIDLEIAFTKAIKRWEGNSPRWI